MEYGILIIAAAEATIVRFLNGRVVVLPFEFLQYLYKAETRGLSLTRRETASFISQAVSIQYWRVTDEQTDTEL